MVLTGRASRGAAKRQSSTFSACSEKSAKLTPFPVHVAPRGSLRPGQTRSAFSAVSGSTSIMRKKHRKKTGGQQAFLRGFRRSFDCGPPQRTRREPRPLHKMKPQVNTDSRTATKPSRFFASSRLDGKACPQIHLEDTKTPTKPRDQSGELASRFSLPRRNYWPYHSAVNSK